VRDFSTDDPRYFDSDGRKSPISSLFPFVKDIALNFS